MIDANSLIGKKYAAIEQMLLSNSYRMASRRIDRANNLMRCSFVTRKNGHNIITLAHDWEAPDQFGIAKAGCVVESSMELLPE